MTRSITSATASPRIRPLVKPGPCAAPMNPDPAEKPQGEDAKAEETSLDKFCVDLNAKARAGGSIR